jgi:hypothetical protein
LGLLTMSASERNNKAGRSAGSGGNARLVVIVLLTAGLTLAVLGGVLSSRRAARADSAWNTKGYAKAYREAARAFVNKHAGEKVNRKSIETVARQTMWLPKYVPGASMSHQQAANIFGVMGFLGFFLVISTLVGCIYAYRREIYKKLVGKRVYR